MQSPPFPRYLVPPRSKYSPQHHVLKHPQLPFLPQCQRPSFTPIQNNRQNYSYIYIYKYIYIYLELSIKLTKRRITVQTSWTIGAPIPEANPFLSTSGLRLAVISARGLPCAYGRLAILCAASQLPAGSTMASFMARNLFPLENSALKSDNQKAADKQAWSPLPTRTSILHACSLGQHAATQDSPFHVHGFVRPSECAGNARASD